MAKTSDPREPSDHRRSVEAPVSPSESRVRATERRNAIRALLLDVNEAPATLSLLGAFHEEEIVATSKATAYAYLLNHHAADIRGLVAKWLSELQPALPQVDLLPILFSTWKREPNEVVRKELGVLLRGYSCDRLGSLERYFEDLSFSVYAKRADLKNRTTKRELAPDQFERALVVLHLDHSSEARQMATAVLSARFNHLTSEQRGTLCLSMVFALSDPRIFSEYVVSNLLYLAEQFGDEGAEILLPLVRRHYDSENPSIRADSALVGMCLGECDEGLIRVVQASIVDPSTFASPVDVPDLEPPEFPRIDSNLEVLGRWVEEVSGYSPDSGDIHDLFNELHIAYRQMCSDVIATFNSRVDLLYQRLRGLSLKPDDLSRELFILRAGARVEKLSGVARYEVLEALLGVMESSAEDIRMRKSVISRVVCTRESSDLVVARVRGIAEDSAQPEELRSFAHKAITGLYPT